MNPKKIFSLMLMFSLVASLCLLTMPATSALAAPPASDEGFAKSYTVAQGDTLSALAQKFGTTIDQLSAANAIDNPNSIRVGQTLMVPASPALASDPDLAWDILDQQQLASNAVAYDYHGDQQSPTDSDDVAAASASAPAMGPAMAPGMAAPANAPITPGLDD
jgi:LysM repeat protein